MFQAIDCRISCDSGMSRQNSFEPKYPFHGNASYSRDNIGILTYTVPNMFLQFVDARGESARAAIRTGRFFFSW